MRLISPNGVRVRVSDEFGERLLRSGYKRVGVANKVAPAPVQGQAVKAPESAPKRRGRPRKATTPDNN